MADSIVGGLFGMTPESYQDTRQLLEQRQALQQAQLDPYEAVNYMAARAGQQLGRGLGGLLGGQDPTLQRISAFQNLASQADLTSPQGYATLGQQLIQSGDTGRGMALIQRSQDLAKEQAQTAQYAGVQQERERKALEETNVKRSRMQALMDSGAAKTMDEAAALASNDQTFQEAIGLSKLSPAAKAEKAMYTKASELYPNDPVLQYQYVESVKQGSKPHTDAEIKDIAETRQGNVIVQSKIERTNDYLSKVSGPKPQVLFGPASNFKAWAESTGFLGEPSDNTKAQDDVRSYLTEGVNGVLNAAKGVQAKDDALRAQKQIEGYLKLNTNAGAEQALKRLKQAQEDVLASNNVYLESRVRKVPAPSTPTGSNPMSRRDELLKRATPEQRKQLGLN
jgi:hypothetical protein